MLLTLLACTPSTLTVREAPHWATTSVVDTAPPTGSTPAGSTPATDTAPEGSTAPTSTCPTGLICVDSFPFLEDGTTTGAPSLVDAYGCAPGTDESGPEVVYQVQVDREGLLVASLSGLPDGVDVDVQILSALDPDACLDRDNWNGVAPVAPGTYYVAVDSWVTSGGDVLDGAYTLTLGLDAGDDHEAEGLDAGVWATALDGFAAAWAGEDTDRLEYGVLDFSRPSTEPRMFWVDLRTGDLLYGLLASHGIGSQDPDDLAMASSFSNVSGSNASSLGMLRTAETFDGDHGYSLRLDGLEPGWNDNVRDRAIIVHNADYATQAFVDDYGYLGRSWGCPAVDPAVSESLIDTIKGGALMLDYYPDPDWLASSPYL
jgi:hypothetical protein